MATRQPSDFTLSDYLDLKKKYEELQLRVTRFSVTEQELNTARNRLDQEVSIYRRMQQFNSMALNEMADDDFLKLVTESLIDIFELELAFVSIERGGTESYSLAHLEGYPIPDAGLQEIKSQIGSLSPALQPNKVRFLDPAASEALRTLLPLHNGVLTMVTDPALQITLYLLGGDNRKRQFVL